MQENSIQTCVTSPPYFQLRDFGSGADQLGMENTPEEFIEKLVEIFRAVRRVLRPDGCLWVNIGDSYDKNNVIGIPWLLAFALRKDRWFVRSEIIWHKTKPNTRKRQRQADQMS
jgi:DNA modification methylase